MTNAVTRKGRIRLAVFGSPVAQSKSPLIHSMFARQAGLDVAYDAREASAGTLASALETLADEGGVGANITAPLKQEAMRLAVRCSARVTRAGAANTLTFRQAGWYADTTDGVGLVADLVRLGCDPEGLAIHIVGAGGATAGVLAALLEAGATRIDIFNRTPATAVALAEAHSDLGEVFGHGLDALETAATADLVLNATSVGHNGGRPPLSRRLFAPGARCYDLNYGPAAKPVLDWCSENGIPAYDGLGMLVGQAAASFETWTGYRPDPTPVLDALRKKAEMKGSE